MEIYIVDKALPTDRSGLLISPSPMCLLEENRRTPQAQAFLAQIRESRQELRCGCNPIEPARMFIRYCHGYYTVVNHATEGHHSLDCPLYTEINGFTSNNSTIDDEDDVSAFMLHANYVPMDYTERVCSESTLNVLTTSTKREAKLAKLFRYLSQHSFQNYHYKNKRLTPLQALHHLLEPSKNIKFGNTTLNEWVFYGPKGFVIGARKLHDSICSESWNGAGRPHCLVFVVADSIEYRNKNLIVDGKAIKVHKVANVAKSTLGPYLVILSLAINPHVHRVEVYNAYIHPVVSSSLMMPINSDGQRDVGLYLAELIDNSNSSISWSLCRPLISDISKARSACVLPDYILKGKNHSKRIVFTEIIEVREPSASGLLPLIASAWRANKVSNVDPHSAESMAHFMADHERMLKSRNI
ncbi:hypothetical protein ABMX62_20335 [Vibrio vulnificus]|uniref:hypothetical protein n=1 Tax=Vibrio vulnificus TaxID=672 RepID=UPI00405A1043